MDRNSISIIGIIDTLKYLLETDDAAKKSKGAKATLLKLERTRIDLLREGLRYSQVMGAARDSVFEVTSQLEGHISNLQNMRQMQWVIHGLLSVDMQEVEPPLLPSSSAGPRDVAPEVLQVAEALVEMARRPTDTAGINRIEKLAKNAQIKQVKSGAV